jgi:hypothetical protein
MKKKTKAEIGKRMIHIRLDIDVHRQLKMRAVREDTTVQNLVESLIHRSFLDNNNRRAGK